MTSLPLEIINKILMFRGAHPDAQIIKDYYPFYQFIKKCNSTYYFATDIFFVIKNLQLKIEELKQKCASTYECNIRIPYRKVIPLNSDDNSVIIYYNYVDKCVHDQTINGYKENIRSCAFDFTMKHTRHKCYMTNLKNKLNVNPNVKVYDNILNHISFQFFLLHDKARYISKIVPYGDEDVDEHEYTDEDE